MYPAVEITLRLDHVYAAERPSPTALGSAFRDLHVGTNLLPLQAARKTSPGLRTLARTAQARTVDHCAPRPRPAPP